VTDKEFAKLLYSTSAGCSQGAAIDEYRKLLTALDDSRTLSLHMAKWIVEHHAHRPFEKDHACARCVPGAESVVPGFVCVLHVATGLFEASQPAP
jgi:hypothetical protein